MTTTVGILRGVMGLVRRLRSDSRGNIGLMAALIGPGVILLGVGAIDLLAVNTAQNRLQSIADAGALAGAPHLALATDGAGAKERAASFVAGEISQWEDAPRYTGSYEVIDQGGQRAIRVVLRGHRPSFFANMLPPGGWQLLEWRMPDPTNLQVVLRIAQPDPSALVQTWEASDQFEDVSVDLGRTPDEVSIKARIVRRTPAAAAGAAR